jgi:hypothetical protein
MTKDTLMPNDATSVGLLVEDNPVLFYKRPGELTETDGLEKHDFCLS